MEHLITPPNITFGIGTIAIIFSVYNYFKNPQIKSEQFDALMGQRLNDIEKQIASFVSAFQTHLVADTTSFNNLNQHIVEVDKSVVRLTTIIDERIPKK